MKIALIGFGKMGKTIEKIALEKGHTIILIADLENPLENNIEVLKKADVAIEFTGPEIAFNNIKTCILNNIPIVSGSTGWLQSYQEIQDLTTFHNGAFFYASNYSIGVNIFFEINKKLAAIMQNYPNYDASILEIHHTEKKDAPSGTAITIAEGILDRNTKYKNWKLDHKTEKDDLIIESKRIDNVPGTHSIQYISDVDTIEITHTAHNRLGFANGALLAAEWIIGKKGVFGMNDLLGI
jgi:4-hydroxy-tetrahydrodipicolinate reductase